MPIETTLKMTCDLPGCGHTQVLRSFNIPRPDQPRLHGRRHDRRGQQLLREQLELLRRTAGAVEQLANPMVRATIGGDGELKVDGASPEEQTLAWAYGVARSFIEEAETHSYETPMVDFLRELVKRCEALR